MSNSPQITGYRGWRNHATWACHLFIKTNKEWEHLRQTIKKSSDAATIAHCIAGEIEKNAPLLTDYSVYSELLCASIKAIDYRQVADAFMEDKRSGKFGNVE